MRVIPSLLRRASSSRAARRTPQASGRSARPRLEHLEERLTPYNATGNAWPHPELVTISFSPDGTDLGGATSNLFATFNAKFGSASTWQNVILQAAQAWAQQTNLNFSVVSDNGTGSGGGDYQQGDPGFGDIRVDGYNYNDPGTLAEAAYPPPLNNFSLGGDIDFNTGVGFSIGTGGYDLFSVAIHEIGHSLGLAHSGSTAAVMWQYYNGIDYALNSDDISGIRSIYSGGSGRSSDSYDAAASNGTSATATDVTSTIDANALTSLLTGLDVTTTSDVDYYKVVAPSGGTGQMTVVEQSTGLSLLAGSLKIYNSSQTLLASATGTGYQGSTLTKTVSVTAGQTYYIRVAGANTTAFGTGKYALTLNFGSGASPTVPLPNTQTLNGYPFNDGGGSGVGAGPDRGGHHDDDGGGNNDDGGQESSDSLEVSVVGQEGSRPAGSPAVFFVQGPAAWQQGQQASSGQEPAGSGGGTHLGRPALVLDLFTAFARPAEDADSLSTADSQTDGAFQTKGAPLEGTPLDACFSSPDFQADLDAVD